MNECMNVNADIVVFCVHVIKNYISSLFVCLFSYVSFTAELIIAQIINLARQLGDKNIQMHQGIWEKVLHPIIIDPIKSHQIK
jgi:hypothetical protein